MNIEFALYQVNEYRVTLEEYNKQIEVLEVVLNISHKVRNSLCISA